MVPVLQHLSSDILLYIFTKVSQVEISFDGILHLRPIRNVEDESMLPLYHEILLFKTLRLVQIT